MRAVVIIERILSQKIINTLIFVFFVISPYFRTKFLYSFEFWGGLVAASLLVFKGIKFKDLSFNSFDGILFPAFLFVGAISSFLNSCLFVYSNYFYDYMFAYLVCLAVRSIVSGDRDALKMSDLAIFLSFASSAFIAQMQMLGLKLFYLSSEERLGSNTALTDSNAFSIRAWGPFGDSLVYSNYIVALGAFCLGFLYRMRCRGVWIGMYSLFYLYASSLPGSRTGFITSLFIVLIAYFLNKGALKLVIVASAVLLAYICIPFDFLSSFNVVQRFLGSDVKGDGRMMFYVKFSEMLFVNPFLGCGMWNINRVLNDFGIMPGFATIGGFGHVESVYLTVILSTGLVGGGLFLLFVFRPLIYFVKNRRVFKEEPAAYAYLAMLLSAMTEPSLLSNVTIMIFFLHFRMRIAEFINSGVKRS